MQDINMTMPKSILLFENAAFLIVSLYLYYVFQGNWLIFIALFFVPDVSMIGYLINPRIGAVIYNLMHNYLISFVLLIISTMTRNEIVGQLAFILSAHVALDRLMGFGLKYPGHFKETHSQKV